MTHLSLILLDIRSTHNVGSLMRSADGFGVDHIYFVGYTPYPKMPGDTRLPHMADKITRAIHKTALGAEDSVPFSVLKTPSDATSQLRKQGYTITALEQAPDSQNLSDYKPPDKLALILGNEITGVTRQTLSQCDVILEIPMIGKKESLNVSVSGAIALYALNYSNV